MNSFIRAVVTLLVVLLVTLAALLLIQYADAAENGDDPAVMQIHYWKDGQEQGLTEVYNMTMESCAAAAPDIAGSSPEGMTLTVECVSPDKSELGKPTRPETRL